MSQYQEYVEKVNTIPHGKYLMYGIHPLVVSVTTRA